MSEEDDIVAASNSSSIAEAKPPSDGEALADEIKAVTKPASIAFAMENSSLGLLQCYGNSDDDDDNHNSNDNAKDDTEREREREREQEGAPPPNQPLADLDTIQARDCCSSEDEEDSDEDSSSSSSQTNSCAEEEDSASTTTPDSDEDWTDLSSAVPKQRPVDEGRFGPKTQGEMDLDDLPPIQNLQISVPEDECVQMGFVQSIVEPLVVVKALSGMPAYDLDTVLFLDGGRRPLGAVFDVFGPVADPCYAVRFNSKQHVLESGVEVGRAVYSAPKTDHTAYVFVADLLKEKGSDASWTYNNEPPSHFLDYSDDEEERMAKRAAKRNSLERNHSFERRMNAKNLLMSHPQQHGHRPSTSQQQQHHQQHQQYQQQHQQHHQQQQHVFGMNQWPPQHQVRLRPPAFLPPHHYHHQYSQQPQRGNYFSFGAPRNPNFVPGHVLNFFAQQHHQQQRPSNK